MAEFNLYDDIIDIRDIIERVEELETETADYENPQGDLAAHDADLAAREELETLTAILDELKGYGGDEQWRGDWYPITLVRYSYFTEYAKELVQDCDGLPRDLPDYIVIDWKATAENVQQDYSSIEIGGATYWYR